MSKIEQPECCGQDRAVGADTPAPVRVLLAEDSDSARILTGAMLRRIGCIVDTVSDGARALLSHDLDPADIVILDIDMPVLDGIETAKRIRQLPPPACNTRLVALSGYADWSLPAVAEGLFDQVLSKPVTREMLRKIVALSVSAGMRPTTDAGGLSDRQWAMLMTLAVRDMRDISAKLAEAQEARDIVKVRHIAHQLQGVAASFGSPEVARLAGELEAQARRHSTLELSRELTDLCTAVVKATLAVIRSPAAPAARAARR